MNISLAVTADELQAEISPIQRFVKVVRHYLTLHLRLKGWCFPQHLCTVRQGNECTTTLPLEVFLSKKLCIADFNQLKLTFIPSKGKVRFLSHPLGDLEVTYALRLQLVGKPVYDFLFVIIELFLQALTVETLQAEICRRERFLKGLGHFDRPFWVEVDVAHQRLLGSKKLKGLPFHVV